MDPKATFTDERTGLRIVPATKPLLRRVAAAMRPEDEREARALTGLNPSKALYASLEIGDATWVALAGEGTLAAFGYAERPREEGAERSAIVWMLSTTHLPDHPRAVVLGTRWWLPQVLETFPGGIGNVMDAGNELHVRFMARQGAVFGTDRLFTSGDRIFVPFVLTPELARPPRV